MSEVLALLETLAVDEAEKLLREAQEDVDTLYDLLEKEVYAERFVHDETEKLSKRFTS